MTQLRFNAPPGWPVPPDGWKPHADWKPEPHWPTAPDGWQFWLPANPAMAAPQPMPPTTVPPAQNAGLRVPAHLAPLAPAPTTPIHSNAGKGIFGGKKHLEEENADLRQQLTSILGLDPISVADQAVALRASLVELQAEVTQTRQRLEKLRADMVDTSIAAELQEIGIYDYHHPLADAVAYRMRLAQLTDQIKSVARAGRAVNSGAGWTVDGSAAEGRRMTAEYTKLMLRAYNAEADGCVAQVRPHKLATALDRLDKVAQTIARLGKTMSICISDEYHRLRFEEIKLTADYRMKLEEEKERVREERERQREERLANQEFEREKARLAKERTHYELALAKLEASGGDTRALAELHGKLQSIDDAIAGVDARAANIRTGYVYVISNIGAFGPDIVKVGMTRRLDPADRVRELGDASVPFRFDTHALIFSQDAVGLETKLHAALTKERVNKINLRREFFYANPARVRDLLVEIGGQHLIEYSEVSEAVEWRQSGTLGRPTQPPAVRGEVSNS